MKAACYLVIAEGRYARTARVARVTAKRPYLNNDEAVIRLILELPDDLFAAPVITVPIEKRSVVVAVEVDEP